MISHLLFPDSDKENSETVTNVPHNLTDIKSHELYIEKEPVPSPKVDDSINEIVKNLPLLNNLKKKDSVELIEKGILNKKRLTENVGSPSQMFPPSSTPVNNKHRSQSIYKFSPIHMGGLESPTANEIIYEDVDEPNDKDQSLVLKYKNLKHSGDNSNNKSDPKNSQPLFSSVEMVSLHQNTAGVVSQSFGSQEDDHLVPQTPDKLQGSEIEPFVGFTNDKGNSSIVIPVLHSKGSKSRRLSSNYNSSGDGYVIKTECRKENTNIDQVELDSEKEHDGINNSQVKLIVSQNIENTAHKDIPGNDLTEPSGPFLGFELENENKDSHYDLCSVSGEMTNMNCSKDNSVTEYEDQNASNIDKLATTIPDKECAILNTENSQGFAKTDFDSYRHNNIQENSKNMSTVSGEFENSNKDVTGDGSKSLCSEQLDGSLCSKDNDESLCSEENDRESLASEENDRESQYDTCNSEQNSFSDDSEELTNEPVVALERLNTSVFNKYYAQVANYLSNDIVDYSLDESIRSVHSSNESENESIEEASSDSYASFETQKSVSSNTSDLSKVLDDSSTERYRLNYEKCNSSLENNDTVTITPNEYGDRCFVTTRRKNEVVISDSFLVLDESQASLSDSNCDKTVISIKTNISPDKTDKDVNELPQNPDEHLHIANSDSEYQPKTDKEQRISFVATRKSAKMATNLSTEHSNLLQSTDIESKPLIVLQPGKKWERSLSIYRRMTMANDNYDQSLLDDSQLQIKGRKYRQSVISMMEMQPECKSTLHNDSNKSRRSTILCRPSRSTIRIVKDTSISRLSLCSTSTDFDELRGYLEDCDDTILELSKLSLEEHDVTVVEKFNEQSRLVASSREYVLRRCNQTEPRLFDECYPDTVLKNCRKIGEGVYGEVYLWRAPDGRARVMKVVPIAGSIRVNGECQKHFHEIISEIVIAMELSALRAPIAEIECHFDEGKDADQLDLHAVENATDVFNEVLAVRCVFGNYPSRLLDLWDLYDESKGSENDNPAVLPADQQYIVLELANAGQDLESYQFNSAEQAHALLLQVAFGLAVGEEAFQFEHRDLHWGNVLIAPTDQKYATFVLRGRSHRVLRRGVAATIIDYSLSRVSLPVSGEACALYNDLATDEELFGAFGDYQFEVYRLMRDKLNNEWKSFEPYTNVLWLHYLVDKMITSLRYKRPGTKLHKQYIAKLKALKDRVLNYGSAVQLVLTDADF